MISLRINTSSDVPIYKQIVEQLRFKILSSKIQAHEKLPGSRALGLELKTNPLTIQKAYQELRNMGLIYNKRGEGSFVAEVSTSDDDTAKIAELREKINGVLDLSCTYSVALSRLQKIWNEEINLRKGEQK
jgi:GntR family transcriptional regulator